MIVLQWLHCVVMLVMQCFAVEFVQCVTAYVAVLVQCDTVRVYIMQSAVICYNVCAKCCNAYAIMLVQCTAIFL